MMAFLLLHLYDKGNISAGPVGVFLAVWWQLLQTLQFVSLTGLNLSSLPLLAIIMCKGVAETSDKS